MIYRKPLTAKKNPSGKKRISNFAGGLNTVIDPSLVDHNCATLSYNIEGKSGAMQNTGGFDEFFTGEGKGKTFPFEDNKKPIIGVWHYKRVKENGEPDDRLILMFDDLSVSYLSLTEKDAYPQPLAGVKFTSFPNAVNFRLDSDDVIIFSSPTDEMIVWDGVSPPFAVNSAPKITSSCIHYERLFATVSGQRHTLWFSDDLDPTNWNVSIDAAGYIEMADEKGELLKVISFLDYLYIFRTYGITRVTAYTDQTQFTVSQLYVSSGRIYPETVTVCGDKILFLSSDGLHAFDGISAKKLLSNIDSLFDGVENSSATACYYGGKYFLACKLNFSDSKEVLCEKSSHKNNCLLVLNLFDGSLNLMRGVDVKTLAVVAAETMHRLILCFNGQLGSSLGQWSDSGKVFERILPKCWVTPILDFGAQEQRKFIRRIFISSRYDCVLEMDCDGKISRHFLRGKEEPAKLDLRMKGYKFKMEFLSDTPQTNIAKVIVDYELLG